jgi:hypothetical protein
MRGTKYMPPTASSACLHSFTASAKSSFVYLQSPAQNRGRLPGKFAITACGSACRSRRILVPSKSPKFPRCLVTALANEASPMTFPLAAPTHHPCPWRLGGRVGLVLLSAPNLRHRLVCTPELSCGLITSPPFSNTAWLPPGYRLVTRRHKCHLRSRVGRRAVSKDVERQRLMLNVT